MSKLFRKKTVIKLLGMIGENYVVCNVGNEDDQWVIPKEVFEKTYEELTENRK